MSDINHIRKYNADGTLVDATTWAPYYPQTDEYWAGDSEVPRNGAGFYGWGGATDKHNYYDIAGVDRLNVLTQHTHANIGNNEPVKASISFQTSGSGIILFATYSGIKYGVENTVTVQALNSFGVNKVYSVKDLASLGITWADMAKHDSGAIREVMDTIEGARVIGVEPVNPWRANVTYSFSYVESPDQIP